MKNKLFLGIACLLLASSTRLRDGELGSEQPFLALLAWCMRGLYTGTITTVGLRRMWVRMYLRRTQSRMCQQRPT